MSLLLSPKQASAIAQDVYEISEAGISRAMQVSKGLGLRDSSGVGFQRPAEKFIGGTGFFKKPAGFGYVAEGDGIRSNHYLLAMRGTMGKQGISRDWQTNYRINTKQSKSGYKVHAGFQSIFEDFLLDLDAYFKGKRGVVHCVGHSLGGALATLSADYLSDTGSFDVKLYTFGAPRVGLEDFSRNLTSKIGQNSIFRMFHTTDPVPMIAPYPYLHAPFTSMDKLNWGLGIQKAGRMVPGDHSMSQYVKSASQFSDWKSISLTNMEPHTPWEVWLKDAAERKIKGIIQFGADVMTMISKCIRGIVDKAMGIVGSIISASMTALDQLAWILYRGALASVKIAWYLEQLIQVIFRFLGRTVQSSVNITVSFIRWVFDLLYNSVQTLADRALNLVR